MTREQAVVKLKELRNQLASINIELGILPVTDVYTEHLDFLRQRILYQIENILDQYPSLKEMNQWLNTYYLH